MSDQEDDEVEAPKDPRFPLVVTYCGVCGMPPEFCEFGSSWPKCRQWMSEHLPDMFAALSIEAKNDTKPGKQIDSSSSQPGKGGKPKAEPEVTVELVERTKRKRATYVGGLEQFGIKLADAAKIFRHKFATGCNPAKDRPGSIVIQGDVKFEVVELIKTEYKAKIKPTQIKFIEGGAKSGAADNNDDDDDEDDDDDDDDD